MKLDLRRIAARTGPVDLADWPRIIPDRHRTTPCDAGFGSSRFSSPGQLFRVLYAAQDFPTALAEAVIRDRFVGRERRYLYRPYLESLAATTISTTAPLTLVDLTGGGAYDMGVDTDAKGSRAHVAGQAFAEALHRQAAVDGIIFDSRLTGAPCAAIFDRAFARLQASPPVDLLRVAALADELRARDIIVRRRRISAS